MVFYSAFDGCCFFGFEVFVADVFVVGVVEFGEGGHAQGFVGGCVEVESAQGAQAEVGAGVVVEVHFVPAVFDGCEAC